MNNKNTWAWIPAILAIVIAVYGGWVYLSPYMLPDRIQSAAVSHNVEWLEKHIDYETVSQSLTDSAIEEGSTKTDFNMNRAQNRDLRRIFDGYVTPTNIARFYEGLRPVTVDDGLIYIRMSDIDKESYKRRYININTFEYNISTEVDTRGYIYEYTIKATRSNIFASWRIVTANLRLIKDPTVFQRTPETEAVIDAAMAVDRETAASTTEPIENTAKAAGYDTTTVQTYMTSSRNIRCIRDGNAMTCVNKNDDAFFCTQNNCEYDEMGTYTYENTGEVKTGQLQYGFRTCTFTATSVRCTSGNNSAELTSEYMQLH